MVHKRSLSYLSLHSRSLPRLHLRGAAWQDACFPQPAFQMPASLRDVPSACVFMSALFLTMAHIPTCPSRVHMALAKGRVSPGEQSGQC